MTPSPEVIVAGIILVSLTIYVLTGGADYGAGVWTLFARGPRGRAQRTLIEKAIGPIWEANHVWLILIVTLLFTAFPPAFALISVRLHIPLTLMLIGIVLRGAAFAFRSYGVPRDTFRPKWESVFAIASLLTPVLLGVVIGAIASGRLRNAAPNFLDSFVRPWLAPFPLAVGLLALALFALLAAVYLILETDDRELREDFRRRALASAATAAILAVGVFHVAARGAPELHDALKHPAVGLSMLGLAAGFKLAVIGALWRRWYPVARVAVVGEVIAILWGWGLAQYPFLVAPDITIESAAAPSGTLRILLGALILGAAIVFPSLYYLFKIFKSRTILRH